ncbi:MAG: hypothetical protein U0237_20580 [Thermoleophilia bacterium]
MRSPRPPRVFVLAALLALAGGGVATGAKLITGAQIQDSSLTGRDIRDGSIGPRDLAAAIRNGITGPAGPAGATGPQGPVGPQGPAAAGGVVARDGDGTVLGPVVGVSSTYFTVLTSTGNAVFLLPSGASYDQFLYWTGPSCTGTPYFGTFGATASPGFGGFTVASPVAGGLLVPADPDANGQAPNVSFTYASTSVTTCSAGSGSQYGYRMRLATPASVGLPAYPVAAPVTLH